MQRRKSSTPTRFLNSADKRSKSSRYISQQRNGGGGHAGEVTLPSSISWHLCVAHRRRLVSPAYCHLCSDRLPPRTSLVLASCPTAVTGSAASTASPLWPPQCRQLSSPQRSTSFFIPVHHRLDICGSWSISATPAPATSATPVISAPPALSSFVITTPCLGSSHLRLRRPYHFHFVTLT
ncbi:hypothetical protein F5148DRAFT_805904 [Russula earlei]|uniref:Uncharacterized protein n=1 Tax=Russula earlei TaxID=71964 RepID=A0ACC0UD78_9AGAM|nr:hypothetical protein F5148DRAFT_805904 [Russula earlei]